MMQRVEHYLNLTKPRIIMLILVTTVATIWLAGAPVASLTVVAVLFGTACVAGSANALNCYIDRDIDAVMHRTRERPLPQGDLIPAAALRFGLVLGAAGFIILWQWVNPLTAVLAISGNIFYVVIYTSWLKRSTPQNIVIGGAAGAVGPLIGWAAATGSVGWPAVILFLIIFLWTPPHFWALALYSSDDYERAGVPMMPVVRGQQSTKQQIFFYTILLFIVTLALSITGVGGTVYLAAAGILGAGFIVHAWRCLQSPGSGEARKLFRYSILYLGLLFSILVVDVRWF